MNLILSVAAGYNWRQLKVFVKSLRKYYNDKALLILNNIDLELKNNLQKFSIDYIVDKNIVASDCYQSRYKLYYNYLNSNKKNNYNNVLITDSRDVFFQNNPFSFFYNNKLNFFLENELIKNSSVNSKWISRTVGKKFLKNLKNNYISNCGQIIGEYQHVLNYCNEMDRNIFLFKYKPSFHSIVFKRKINAWDQGIHNYLVYSNILKNIGFYSNKEGNVANLCFNKNFNFNSSKKLINDHGYEYSIVHMYDRFINYFDKIVSEIEKL